MYHERLILTKVIDEQIRLTGRTVRLNKTALLGEEKGIDEFPENLTNAEDSIASESEGWMRGFCREERAFSVEWIVGILKRQ